MTNPDRPDPRLPAARRDDVASSALMKGRSTLRIVHGDEAYTLRVTRNGKLILTK